MIYNKIPFLIMLCFLLFSCFNKKSIVANENEQEIIIIESIESEIIDYKNLTYDELLEIFMQENIKNKVLEILNINDKIYTVIEVRNEICEVGTDLIVEIYDIPDESGNVLLTLPYKNKIMVTMIAIVEEKYQYSLNDYNYYENWVKIKTDDGIIGWVEGQYVNMNRGGPKYFTTEEAWWEENYSGYYDGV